MAIVVVGLDIAKNVFQVHGVDEAGKVVLRRRLRRDKAPSSLKSKRQVRAREFFAKTSSLPRLPKAMRQVARPACRC